MLLAREVDARAYGVKVALRAWEPSLRQEYEFRGFVFEGALTAISQYNDYCYLPEQVQQADHICATLERFWRERVAPAAAPLYASYVVDFALLAGGEPRVIELNPFDEQTGAGLFSWERDRDALQRAPPPGEPCPLRLATQPRPRMQPTLEVLLLELPRESARTATPRSIDTPGDTQITRDDRAAARTDRIALTSSGCQVL